MQQTTSTTSRTNHILKLKEPSTVAIYDNYKDASRAVDYLSDNGFPVDTLAIVGTDLKSYEKVTGTMNWGKVLLYGFLQGVMLALMFSLLFAIFMPATNFGSLFLSSLIGFSVICVVLAAIQYAMRGGKRDFTSASGIIAAHYEIIAESQTVAQARELLGRGQNIPRPTTDLSAMPPPQFPAASNQTAQENSPAQPTADAGQPTETPAAPAEGPEFPVPGPRPDESAYARDSEPEPRYGQLPYGAFGNTGSQGIGTPPQAAPAEFQDSSPQDGSAADEKSDEDPEVGASQ